MALEAKNPPAKAGNARDTGSIPGSERSPGGGNGNPLQYSCLESYGQRNLMGCCPRGRRESDTTEYTRTQTLNTLGQIHFPGCNVANFTLFSVSNHEYFMNY